jgi:ubiquinone biosynthesis accessory factor UbiJ
LIGTISAPVSSHCIAVTPSDVDVALSAKVLNRALAQERWAQARLAAHAGTTTAVKIGRARAMYTIAGDGTLIAAEENSVPTLTLTIAPFDLPALLAQPGRWNELVVAEGDAGLASTLADLALTLPWLVEGALSRWFGPIVGTRMADAGRAMLTLPGYAAKRAGESVVRYVSDDAGLLAEPRDFRGLASDTAALAERVEALAARIAALDDTRQP